jgi:hypothetical protein
MFDAFGHRVVSLPGLPRVLGDFGELVGDDVCLGFFCPAPVSLKKP